MAYSVPESGSLTAEESKNLIQSLKGEYGISMEEIDRATLMKSGFQEVTGDQLARLSGVLQQAPGLLANRAIQKNYEGAVRLVVPPDMPEGAHAMAAKKLGTDVFYGEYVNDKNRIAGKAGYQNIDATAANAAQLANAVFAAASVATQQHYLHNIDKKLKALKSSTADILQFLELDKRTELQAQQAFLTEIFENLEAINLCEDQRRATITSVQTIRQKAMSAMVFYQERTRQRTQTRPSDAGKTEIKENIRKITADIAPYWLSIHTYGMAYILEILLTKNFNSRYLKNIARILREQQQKYDACYTECAEEISRYVQKLAPEKRHALVDALASSRIPGVWSFALNRQVNIAFREQMKRSDLSGPLEQQIAGYGSSRQLQTMADSVELLNQICHKPLELALDGEKIYMRAPEYQEQA